MGINLTMIGSLISSMFIAIAVWLSMQWQPNGANDREQLLALALTYIAGLLTAISSQLTVHVREELNDTTNGKNNHDYKKITD